MKLRSSRARHVAGLAGSLGALATVLGVAACSTTAAEPLTDTGIVDDGEAEEDEGDEGDEGGGSSGDRGDDDGTDDGPPPDAGTSDGGVQPEPGLHPPCPRPLPPEWVFCTDFEATEELGHDLGDVFFEYQDADDAFVPVEGGAASGLRSMQASYREGFEDAGWLSVAFGRNPIVFGAAPQYAGDSDFPSIYWRLRVKMEHGWPDIGPHHLSRITAFAGEDWLQAMAARLRSDGDGVVLVADPTSCVNGDSVACSAYEDVEVEKSLGALAGAFPLFSSQESGEWHCVEAHVALNTPGLTDGVFEFWVDGEMQNARYDLDWRGSWQGYGLNLVTVENRWVGGAPKNLTRWIDDLVISTAPIGCD